MAKRFLDTGFYKSPFVRGLKAPLKLLYSFIICDCDGAGIWNCDFEIAGLYIGQEVSKEDFEAYFVKPGKAIDLKNGKYFFPDFLEHQYPQGLSEKNPAQKNFINDLKKYDLLDDELKYKKPLQSPFKAPSKGSKVMVKEKVMVEVKEKVMVTGTLLEKKLDQFYKFRKELKKPVLESSKPELLEKLNKLSSGDESRAIEILSQSISNGWQGIFALNSNDSKTDKKPEINATIEYSKYKQQQ